MSLVLDNKYTLGKVLGEGAFGRVYEARDNDGGKYAVKTWTKFDQKQYQDEARATLLGEHPHLVKYYEASKNAPLVDNANGKTTNCAYILMEHVGGGELLQTLIDHGGFSEPICRAVFKEMLMGINHLHQKGMCHRDLKPDNILFTTGFDIKVTDFGFMLPLEGRERLAWLKSRVGTLTYMAPEVLAREKYQGKQADIYSLGVILFILLIGNMPVESASSDDRFFRYLSANKPDMFWAAHQKSIPDMNVSPQFKELINLMLSPDACLRIDMGDIICHPWMQGEIATKEEVVAEMESRNLKSKQMAETQRVSSGPSGEPHRDFELGGTTYVVDFTGGQAEDEKFVKLDLRSVEDESEFTRALTNRNPDEIFNELREKFKEFADDYEVLDIVVPESSWKVEIRLSKNKNTAADEDDEEEEHFEGLDEEENKTDENDELAGIKEECKLMFEVVKTPDDKRFLTCTKSMGSFLLYREVWDKIQNTLYLLQ